MPIVYHDNDFVYHIMPLPYCASYQIWSSCSVADELNEPFWDQNTKALKCLVLQDQDWETLFLPILMNYNVPWPPNVIECWQCAMEKNWLEAKITPSVVISCSHIWNAALMFSWFVSHKCFCILYYMMIKTLNGSCWCIQSFGVPQVCRNKSLREEMHGTQTQTWQN